MVRLPILLLAVAFAPALAAQASLAAAQTSLTIEQFEKSIPALHGMRDKRAARELAPMKLTQRASLERAAHWQTEMPGKLSAEALMAMVDASGFLDLPTDEAPAAPPEVETQKQIVTRSAEYVQSMLHKLPNFYATRTTTHFESATPEQVQAQEEALTLRGLENGQMMPLANMKPVKLPHQELGPVDAAKPELGRLFFMSAEERLVTYANGGEVDASQTKAGGGGQEGAFGLATNGEFGPILEMLLVDVLERGVSWSHWEKGAGGRVAVFRYAVPKDLSHFQMETRSGVGVDHPAYHGELAVDPESGAILRIVIEATVLDKDDLWSNAEVLVDYGAVDIGGRTYTCPLHGVAITRPAVAAEAKTGANPTFLNDTIFSGYHLFRGEVRIVR